MESNLWITAVLVMFCSLDDVFPKHLDCKARARYIQHVVPHSQVSITCPNLTGNDLSFHLLVSVHESSVKIHTTVLKKTKEQNRNHTATNRQETFVHFGPVEPALNQNLSNRYVFTVNGTGLYSCVAERLWPPPYKEDRVETLLIEDKQCPGHQDPLAKHNCAEDPRQLLLWLLVACGVLTVYSIIATAIIWRKLKKETSDQSVYMNVTPAERKGKKRVQQPAIRRL